MSECICEGNFRKIIHEYEPYFNKKYRDNKGEIYVFVGIVYADDDFYYGMYNISDGNFNLLSCVGDIKDFEYELLP